MSVFTTAGSEYVYVQGKVSWVKYITPDPLYNKWSVCIHPNEEGMKILQSLKMDKGIKNDFHKDEDGYYMNFSRPIDRKIKGKVVPMTPPVVLKLNPETKKGEPIENLAIGNGSDGTLKLEVYSYPTPTGGRGHAARFTSLMIENLIPFNKDTDFPDPAQREQAEGLDEQPKQMF